MSHRDRTKLSGRLVALATALGLVPGLALAQVVGSVPAPLVEVGVVEHLDEPVPLDLVFRAENGDRVPLSSFFDGERPVVLTLNYYRCPMLCGLQLNGLLDGLTALDWTAGDQFEMVTVSIDPLETPDLATAKKASYLERYARPAAETGWHFLTGEQEAIVALASAVGFGYVYDEEERQYAHAAVTFVITPDGRVARYLYGVEYPAQTLKLALLEAADGRIGSSIDRLLLYCYQYSPDQRRYTPVVMNIMRLGGGLTAFVLVSCLSFLWIREARRRKTTNKGNPTP